MTLIPWKNKQRGSDQSETSRMLSLRDEIDRLFDAFVREPFAGIDWPFGLAGRWTPAMDIAENDTEIIIRAELPGIDPKDIDISVSGNELVLTGDKKESSESQEKDFRHSETRYGSFRRRVPLPKGINTEDVEAVYSNGVLTLRLKKLPAVATKRIEVKIKE